METYSSAGSLEMSLGNRWPSKNGAEPYPNLMLLMKSVGTGAKHFQVLFFLFGLVGG